MNNRISSLKFQRSPGSLRRGVCKVQLLPPKKIMNRLSARSSREVSRNPRTSMKGRSTIKRRRRTSFGSSKGIRRSMNSMVTLSNLRSSRELDYLREATLRAVNSITIFKDILNLAPQWAPVPKIMTLIQSTT